MLVNSVHMSFFVSVYVRPNACLVVVMAITLSAVGVMYDHRI